MPDEDGNPSANHIILDNPPTEDSAHNRGLAPMHKQIIQPLATHIPKTTIPTTDIIKPPLHHLTHALIPTQAIKDSHASEQAIQDAHTAGEALADDKICAIDDHEARAFHTDSKLLPDPQNYWLPNSYDEAMTHPNIWGEPIKKELDVMRKHRVWAVVDHPEAARLIKTHWTFANKYNADGNLSAHKAQLVTKGFTQIPGVYFFETYASIV